MTIETATEVLVTATYGSSELLDAVEFLLDEGKQDAVDFGLSNRIETNGYDPAGELRGEAYWKRIAGEPNPEHATFPTSPPRRHYNKGVQLSINPRPGFPIMKNDRRRGRAMEVSVEV